MLWRIIVPVAQAAAAIPVFGPWWVGALNDFVDSDDDGGEPEPRSFVLRPAFA